MAVRRVGRKFTGIRIIIVYYIQTVVTVPILLSLHSFNSPVFIPCWCRSLCLSLTLSAGTSEMKLAFPFLFQHITTQTSYSMDTEWRHFKIFELNRKFQWRSLFFFFFLLFFLLFFFFFSPCRIYNDVIIHRGSTTTSPSRTEFFVFVSGNKVA